MKRKDLVLEAIDQLTNQNGYAPTIREIAVYADFKSSSSVKRYMDILRKEERIDFQEGMPRTVRITS